MSTHTPGKIHALKYPDCKTWTVASDQSIASKIKSGADALRLAHCWNCHDELVEALSQLINDCRSGSLDHSIITLEQARAALNNTTNQP